jgi:hypothetical protein
MALTWLPFPTPSLLCVCSSSSSLPVLQDRTVTYTNGDTYTVSRTHLLKNAQSCSDVLRVLCALLLSVLQTD